MFLTKWTGDWLALIVGLAASLFTVKLHVLPFPAVSYIVADTLWLEVLEVNSGKECLDIID